jgi:prepilin-type processing-associated H-X9-DG protein
LGQLYKGVLPFHLATQPYIKNYQVFGCPSDDKKQNASVDRSDMKVMLVAAGVPGAANLPNYSNTPAFHEAVAAIFPNSYGTNYILSQTYGYTRRDGGGVVYGVDDTSAAAVAARGPATNSGRGRYLTDISEPANTWIMTEIGAQNVTGTGGWYTTPGYLNDQVANGNAPRWRSGRRHQEGRHWLFVDGHVKWYKDAPFESSPGTPNNAGFFENHYNNLKVFTTPN